MWKPEEIAYCNNVHGGNSAQEVEENLRHYTAKVRNLRGLASMDAGLWLNESVANTYAEEGAFARLKQCLASANLRVTTLNGFPQGNFHQPVVKHEVYTPTWAEKTRLSYTASLAQILAGLLPDDQCRGTISTLPLGYQGQWSDLQHQKACRNLCLFAKKMATLESSTGKHIRLCLEMEPGCVLETTEQMVDFFTRDLKQAARAQFIEPEVISRYLGVCYDVCHQAVMHEDIQASVAMLDRHGIVLGKLQISSAMHIDRPSDPLIRQVLAEYAEPKYLHQITTLDESQNLIFCDDLKHALNDANFPTLHPWRIHFHLPIHADVLNTEGMATTRSTIEDLCRGLKSLDYTPHIEVETYTWDVLPKDDLLQPVENITQGIWQELRWLQSTLNKHDLLVC